MRSNRAGNGTRAIAALHPHGVTGRKRLGEPVDLFERQVVSEQLRAAADDDLASLGANRDDVQRLVRSARQTAALTDSVAREAVMLADHGAACRHEPARNEA